MNKITAYLLFSQLLLAFLSGCASSSGVIGNDKGSEPINEKETVQYRQAVLKCYKTGGTRVVKIQGKLQCY